MRENRFQFSAGFLGFDKPFKMRVEAAEAHPANLGKKSCSAPNDGWQRSQKSGRFSF
jgi:hypothetical protein